MSLPETLSWHDTLCNPPTTPIKRVPYRTDKEGDDRNSARDENGFLTRGIDEQLFMGDAVQEVSDWLLQGYLKDIGALVAGNDPANDHLVMSSHDVLKVI
jgi:hypothetical protein